MQGYFATNCPYRIATDLLSRFVRGLLMAWLVTPLLGAEARAGGYRILSDTTVPTKSAGITIRSVSATRDGGFLLTGQAEWNEVLLTKIAASGSIEFQRTVSEQRGRVHEAFFALEAIDGGYWIVGMARHNVFKTEEEIAAANQGRGSPAMSLPDVSFLSKIGKNGELIVRHPLGLREGFRGSRFVCGIAISDGLILVGTKFVSYSGQPRDGLPLVAQPWVVKLSTSGDLIWDAVLESTDESVFVESSLESRLCSGPFVDDKGAITFGLSVNRRPTFVKDGVRIVSGREVYGSTVRTYLTTRMSNDGRLISLRYIDKEANGRLMPVEDGYMLISNAVPAFRNGIRVTRLGSDLSVMQSKTIDQNEYFVVVESAAVGPRGGFHIAGFRVTPPNERGHAAIGFLRGEKEELWNVRTFGSGTSSWDILGLVRGVSERDVAIALKQDSIVRLVRLRLDE